jgi:hypothetical protein
MTPTMLTIAAIAPVVTLIGKAFWDIGHAPKDQSNCRKNLPGYAVWEIHPVMNRTIASHAVSWTRMLATPLRNTASSYAWELNQPS